MRADVAKHAGPLPRADRGPSGRRSGLMTTVLSAILLLCAGLLYVHYRDARELPTNAGYVPPTSVATTPAPLAAGPVGAATSHSATNHSATHPSATHHPSAAAHSTTAARPVVAAPPATVNLDDLHVEAPVIPVVVTDGSLGVPDNPRTLGWWTGGAQPGASTGTVVIDGHVDSAQLGIGALFYLSKIHMGTSVRVTTASGTTMTYTVVGRRVYHKTALPPDLFTRSGAPRLVLITCGGPFDSATKEYLDNVVVYAVPAS